MCSIVYLKNGRPEARVGKNQTTGSTRKERLSQTNRPHGRKQKEIERKKERKEERKEGRREGRKSNEQGGNTTYGDTCTP